MRAVINKMSLKFESHSVNEAFARQAVGAFVAQLDPTMEELGDIKTVVSEAVTNAIVHGYADKCGFIHVHHGRRHAQRHGIYHHGDIHGQNARALHAGEGNAGCDGQGAEGAAGVTGEMRTLLEQAASGDRDAEAQLIEDNSGLIWSIARRYYGRGTEPDDLYQLACVGFIKAVRGFDVSLGNEFSTYAVPKIAGEIRRFLRDDGAVKVSRAVKERAVRVRRLQSDWESRNGRSPTVSELAQAAGLTVEEVAACEQADVSVDSFERELSGGGRLGDLVGDEGMEERTCLHLSLHDALQDLPERDRQVLSLRYSRDLTQQQVSRIVGVSQVQVSRIEKRAIEKLREMLRE